MPNVRWIHISDVQIGQGRTDYANHSEYIERLIPQVVDRRPDFVVNTGDCINGAIPGTTPEKIEQHWRTFSEVMAPLRALCPVLACPGNHDRIWLTDHWTDSVRKRVESPSFLTTRQPSPVSMSFCWTLPAEPASFYSTKATIRARHVSYTWADFRR